METIIGLLFILLPVIFNLIGKRLEKSGKQDTAARMREIAKTLGGDDEDQDVVGWLTEEKDDVTDERQSAVVPEPAKIVVDPKPVYVAPKPVVPHMEKIKGTTVKPKKVLLEETEPERRKR